MRLVGQDITRYIHILDRPVGLGTKGGQLESSQVLPNEMLLIGGGQEGGTRGETKRRTRNNGKKE